MLLFLNFMSNYCLFSHWSFSLFHFFLLLLSSFALSGQLCWPFSCSKIVYFTFSTFRLIKSIESARIDCFSIDEQLLIIFFFLYLFSFFKLWSTSDTQISISALVAFDRQRQSIAFKKNFNIKHKIVDLFICFLVSNGSLRFCSFIIIHHCLAWFRLLRSSLKSISSIQKQKKTFHTLTVTLCDVITCPFLHKTNRLLTFSSYVG